MSQLSLGSASLKQAPQVLLIFIIYPKTLFAILIYIGDHELDLPNPRIPRNSKT